MDAAGAPPPLPPEPAEPAPPLPAEPDVPPLPPLPADDDAQDVGGVAAEVVLPRACLAACKTQRDTSWRRHSLQTLSLGLLADETLVDVQAAAAPDQAPLPEEPPLPAEQPPDPPAEAVSAAPTADGAAAGSSGANGSLAELLTADMPEEEDPLLVAEACAAAEENGDAPKAEEPMWPAEDPDAPRLSAAEEDALLKVCTRFACGCAPVQVYSEVPMLVREGCVRQRCVRTWCSSPAVKFRTRAA